MRTGFFKLCGVLIVAVMLVGFTGCEDSNKVFDFPADDANDDGDDNNGGGASGLVVSDSLPVDGDGTLTALGTIRVNNGGTGIDELNLSEMTGAVGHDVTVTWDTTTYALNAVSHGWGSGYTQCVNGTANPCDPAKVTIDFAGKKVTFAGLALIDDVFGAGSKSTLTGTMVW